MGPIAGLGPMVTRKKKSCPCQESNPDRPALGLVTILPLPSSQSPNYGMNSMEEPPYSGMVQLFLYLEICHRKLQSEGHRGKISGLIW